MNRKVVLSGIILRQKQKEANHEETFQCMIALAVLLVFSSVTSAANMTLTVNSVFASVHNENNY